MTFIMHMLIDDLTKEIAREKISSVFKNIKDNKSKLGIDNLKTANNWVEEFFNLIKTSISAVFILALMSITAYKILQSCWYGTFIQDYHDLVGWILKPIADFSKLIESDARFIAIMVIILGIFSAKAIAIIIKYSGIKNLVNLADKVKK